jgi:delta24(24(1))-sterol reductase
LFFKLVFFFLKKKKGEECIPTTWDIFHEKFGWMLAFWNGAGVPYVYCFQSWFLATHSRSEVGIPNWAVALLAAWLLAAYYFWDTIQKQRNSFRMKLNGTYVERHTFPQFPNGVLDPATARCIKTKSGSLLLADGLWAYGLDLMFCLVSFIWMFFFFGRRKLHYTCDIAMALSWGLVCGFTHVLPYFYVTFFMIMITHRGFVQLRVVLCC